MAKKDKKISKNKELSPKRENFCREYVIDDNGTQAAIRAGYSAKAAKEQASRMLTKANIQQRIEELRVEKIARQEKTADDVIRLLWKIAEDDISNYLGYKNKAITIEGQQVNTTDIQVKDSDKIDTWNVNEITLSKEGNFKFKLNDKQKAIQMLKEIYFDKNNNQSGTQDININFGGSSIAEHIKKKLND